uniref:Uncharacterized protein n=1 Tax=Arundo donax TaxID=35708 RepID=A0A0A9AP24_ARUDO
MAGGERGLWASSVAAAATGRGRPDPARPQRDPMPSQRI